MARGTVAKVCHEGLACVSMLSVKELHRIAKTMKSAEFTRQLGPFALVQRPHLAP